MVPRRRPCRTEAGDGLKCSSRCATQPAGAALMHGDLARPCVEVRVEMRLTPTSCRTPRAIGITIVAHGTRGAAGSRIPLDVTEAALRPVCAACHQSLATQAHRRKTSRYSTRSASTASSDRRPQITDRSMPLAPGRTSCPPPPNDRRCPSAPATLVGKGANVSRSSDDRRVTGAPPMVARHTDRLRTHQHGHRMNG